MTERLQSDAFLDNAHSALQQPQQGQQRESFSRITSSNRKEAVAAFPHFNALRAHVKRVKQHALDNLEYYLGKFEQEAVHNGARVHYARDSQELNSVVLDICQQHDVRLVAKGKSMVTEETRLNEFLQSAGLTVTETDLGEYIIQQAQETPSHIVYPAQHKSVDEIRDLFLQNHALGDRDLTETTSLVAEARQQLRSRFAEAEVGIIGANALIAENGYSMLVTNEGNGDLCANLPKILIVCTTIDRVLPLAEDASAMSRLLVRSATGQPQTCYTSFYSGPRREGDVDGPLEMHFVLLDNKRSDLLDSEYQEMLECIRCGACLNHCPVFTSVGGHAYGSVYPGPMGSVLTPLLTSLESSNALPNACSSCGQCAEVCPADIPIPDLLRDLRHEETQTRLNAPTWRIGLRAHALLVRLPRVYQGVTSLLIRVLHQAGKKRGALRKLPFAKGWSSQRDFPAPQANTFMQQYKKQRRAQQRNKR